MRAFVAASLLCVALCAAEASAKSNYPSYIPNGNVHNCNTCHGAAYSTRNAFGQAFQNAKNQYGLNTAWAYIWRLDSDGDGQKNGEELGDPCGVWTYGGPRGPDRIYDISKPGDATSTSPSPYAPNDDADTYSNNCDCARNDPALHPYLTGYADGDGDGYAYDTVGQELCTNGVFPNGYAAEPYQDCDDNDDTVWEEIDAYYDADGDGYANAADAQALCSNGALPAPYIAQSNGVDCDDGDPDGYLEVTGYPDEDEDGVAESDLGASLCTDGALPPGHVALPGADNCPADFNPDQQDRDEDGVGTACDPNEVPDQDGDGVPNDEDNCVDVSNPDQTDADEDGTGNACDTCPYDADNDVDHENICGEIDNCRAAFNPIQADGDEDGIGDACDTPPEDCSNDQDDDGDGAMDCDDEDCASAPVCAPQPCTGPDCAGPDAGPNPGFDGDPPRRGCSATSLDREAARTP